MSSKLELSREVTNHILIRTDEKYTGMKDFIETQVRENTNNPIKLFSQIDNLINSVSREVTDNISGILFYEQNESMEFEPHDDVMLHQMVSNLDQKPVLLLNSVFSKLEDSEFEKLEEVLKQEWVDRTIFLNSNFIYKIHLSGIKDQLKNDNQTEYLIYSKSLSDSIVTSDLLVSKKLKWIGKPTDLCYLITKLSEFDYIEFPQTSGGQNDLVHIISALKSMFEINVSDYTLKKYFGSTKMEEMNTKFMNAVEKTGNNEKEILKIPHRIYLT